MDIRTAARGTMPQTVSPVPGIKEKLTPKEEPSAEEEQYDGNLLIKEYMAFLEENDVSREDIFTLLEHIASSEEILWEDAILGGRIKFSFRLRSGQIEDVISKKIDELAENSGLSALRFTSVVRMLNLAASLAFYNGTDRRVKTEENFTDNYEFISRLPYPILVALGNKLAIFDRAVAVAMSDWAIENFTEPRKEDS